VITAGTSQALDLTTTLFSRPGDTVFIEQPTYHLAVRIFRDHPVELAGIPADEDGIKVDVLASTLDRLKRAGKRVAFLYTIPTFHNPTGAVMAADCRRRLVALAAAEQLRIVEDDAYRELAYDGPAPPSLWSLAQPGVVIRLGSFAKSLAPGLRSGFITTDAETAARIIDSGVLDSGGGVSHFASLVIAEFAGSGEYADNVERLRAAYRRRRDALLAALSGLEGRASWRKPAGGYFLWLSLLDGMRTSELLELAEAQGTSFMPAAPFYLDPASGARSLRLSFSRYPPEMLAEAGRRLLAAAARGPLR
jgi:DNA-binding transcriptional MocR family regulator